VSGGFVFGAAGPADIPAIMAIERRPGYDQLVGRWEEDAHRAEMGKPSVRYFALREGRTLAGFAIVQGIGDANRRAHLKRIAVAEPGSGAGAPLLRGLIGHVFTETDTNRLDLDVFVGNDRARRAYEKAGFTAEGVMREHHRNADGRYRDVWLMSILRREWLAARGAPEPPDRGDPA
jgi:RimJ/RimL family protein N-acetyltransferase